MERLPNLLHDSRNSAGIIEAFRRPASRRADIQKIGRIPVQSVKGISCDFYMKFMGNGWDMKETVGTSRDSSVHQDCVFKALHSDNITGTHIRHRCQLHRLSASFPGKCQKIRTLRRHQRTPGKGKTESFRHNLHSRSCTDKGTRPTTWTGVAFCPVQLLLINLPPLIPGTVHPQLFQSQHLRPGIHGTARHYHRRNIHPCQSHEIPRHSFVTAGQIHTRVKWRGIGMDLNHIGNHLTAGQAVIDSVRSLAFPVTDICTVIACAISPRFHNPIADFLHQNVQMPASRMTVTISAFNDYLRL